MHNLPSNMRAVEATDERPSPQGWLTRLRSVRLRLALARFGRCQSTLDRLHAIDGDTADYLALLIAGQRWLDLGYHDRSHVRAEARRFLRSLGARA